MGAYYHKDFIRGKPELAMTIVYPMFKGPSSPSIGRTSASSAIVAVQKARRRVSTGSITASKVTAEELLVLRATATSRDLEFMSPAPAERITSSQSLLDDDFNKWYATEFAGEDIDSSSMSSLDNLFSQDTNGLSTNKPTKQVTSVISDLEFYRPKFSPPLMFSDDVPFEGRLKLGDCTDQAYPRPKKNYRRHSIASPCATKLKMPSEMICSLIDSSDDWLDSTKLSFRKDNGFTSNDVSWAGMNRHYPQGREPDQTLSHVNLAESTTLEENSCDSYFRKSEIDFVCSIDPFT